MSLLPALPPFKEFVVTVTTDEWTQHQRPLLMSRIGQMAVKAGYRLTDELGDLKLAQFIELQLKHQLIVEPVGGSVTLLQVRPRNPESAQTVEPLEQPTPKFSKGLWLAFSRPIPEGRQRRIQLEPKVRYFDEAPSAGDVAGRLFIDDSYVAKPSGDTASAAARNEAIAQNLRRWMQDHNIDISKFEDTGLRPTPKLSSQNPLMLLIDSLDAGELKRVMLPLDVIAKLIKQ